MAVSTASIALSRTPKNTTAFLYHSTQQWLPCKHVSIYSTKSALVTSQCHPSSAESHLSSSIFPMTGSFYHSRHTSITCSNHRSHLRSYSTFFRPPNLNFPLIPPDYWSIAPLNISRCISRAINIALKRRPKKITIPRTLQLIAWTLQTSENEERERESQLLETALLCPAAGHMLVDPCTVF